LAKEQEIDGKKLSKAETELHDRLDSMVDAGMDKTRQWDSLWQQSLRYFFGDQMEGRKKHKSWDYVVINHIWPSAVQEAAKLSKNNPRIIGNPRTDDDFEAAEVWQGVGQYHWEFTLGMKEQQLMAVLCGKIYGYRVSKYFWEDRDTYDDSEGVHKWVGEIKHRLIKPTTFWTDPDAEMIDEAASLGTDRIMRLEDALARWPKHKKALELEAENFTRENEGGTHGPNLESTDTSGRERKDTDPVAIINLIGDAGRPGDVGAHAPEGEFVRIQEIYFRDYEEREVVVEEDMPGEDLIASGAVLRGPEGSLYDAQTGELMTPDNWPRRTVEEYTEPLYPNGRFILRIGKTILNPGEEAQRYPHRKWPFVVTPHYLLPFMWQGISAVDMVKSTQDMINITASHLLNNMKLYGDPKWIVETGAMATNPRTKKAFKILSGAGSIIRAALGSLKRGAIQRLDPAPISHGTLMIYQLLSQEYKNISGLQSISRGEQAKSRTTATEANVLALSANDRIALQSVYEDIWVRRGAQLIIEICQANYTVDRYIRIVGEDKIVGSSQITEKIKLAKFDIDIEPGVSLPFDEEKRQQAYMQAYELMSNPTPNPMLPDVLRILEITNWKRLISEHEGWQRYMQFMQLLQAVGEGQVELVDAQGLLAEQLAAAAPPEEEAEGGEAGTT